MVTSLRLFARQVLGKFFDAKRKVVTLAFLLRHLVYRRPVGYSDRGCGSSATCFRVKPVRMAQLQPSMASDIYHCRKINDVARQQQCWCYFQSARLELVCHEEGKQNPRGSSHDQRLVAKNIKSPRPGLLELPELTTAQRHNSVTLPSAEYCDQWNIRANY